MNRFGLLSQVKKEKIANAYLLVYERVNSKTSDIKLNKSAPVSPSKLGRDEFDVEGGTLTRTCESFNLILIMHADI